jgi:hypothetical protein
MKITIALPVLVAHHDDDDRPGRRRHRGFDGYGERWARYGDRIVRAADPTDPRD